MEKETKPSSRGRVRKRRNEINNRLEAKKNETSRSRSRSKRKYVDHNKNNNDNNNNYRDMISSYSLSSSRKDELYKLLRSQKKEYFNKKKEAHNKISEILNSMTSEQEERYECWNRSVIPKNIVKNIMNNILNKNSSSNNYSINIRKKNIDNKCVIVMQALSKCLVMELTAKSREIQKKQISNFIKQKNKNKKNKNNKQQKQKKQIIDDIFSCPPLVIDDDDDIDNNHKNGINGNDNNDDYDQKVKDDDINKITQKKNEEKFMKEVLGPIRPIHIREALRILQHDPSSFFHIK